MAGDPGTGKTSFIRHLITEFKLNADVIYDEEAFKADYVFQNFLFDSASTVLIVEDADTVLKKRETEYNPLMSRFLNVTEGLINLPEKKLIFTTNLNDFTEVDPALIRPGRCFDIMRTRPYTYMEALQVCAFMNWPVPNHNKEYTVAELATNKSNPQQRKVGYK
jgi:SpoVK/Ycf46/Vps4 family AAA+-type ATPase